MKVPSANVLPARSSCAGERRDLDQIEAEPEHAHWTGSGDGAELGADTLDAPNTPEGPRRATDRRALSISAARRGFVIVAGETATRPGGHRREAHRAWPIDDGVRVRAFRFDAATR